MRYTTRSPQNPDRRGVNTVARVWLSSLYGLPRGLHGHVRTFVSQLKGDFSMKTDLRTVPTSELLARVAIQVVRRRVNALNSPNIPPSSIVYSASYLLPHDGFSQLRFALHSLAAHLSCGYSSSDWLKGVAYRAAFGGVFRWHFFAQYKSQRQSYPRVTNRGVQTSLQADFSVMQDNKRDD